MGNDKSADKKPFGFGSTSRRFARQDRRIKGSLAKDRCAFDQAMQGNDCTRLRRGGDFVVQRRDFFGERSGEPVVFDVKTASSKVTEAELNRHRKLGRNRHKIVRY